MIIRMVFVTCLGLILLTACGPSAAPQTPEEPGQPAEAPPSMEVRMSFTLTSTAIAQGEPIPVKYSCDGSNFSPPLAWSDPPTGVRSFALIMDDPDAPGGVWVHWVLYNIPTTAHGWPENTPSDPELVNGALQGVNSWGSTGYGGPCPPSGRHRYYFKLYALDTKLDLAAGASKASLLKAMQGHILGQAELMGTFSR